MISKEDFQKIVDSLREKLDETSSALISEDSLAVLSNYNSGYDEYQKLTDEVDKLKKEKEDLLKVNGKLYQKIGFDKEDEKENKEDEKEKKEEIKIEDVIDEKGDFI